jgi:5-methylcytosine-specific restriction protein A
VSERLYNTKVWRVGRVEHLACNPLCVYCLKLGLTVPATVVDHIIPHKGDESLFFDESNWQSLCKRCHDSVKKRQELGQYMTGCDGSGAPLDPTHPWNR